MRRMWGIAALMFALLAAPAFGQMRGGMAVGGRGHGFGGHPSFGHSGIVIGTFHSGVHFRTGFGSPFFHRGFRRFFFPYSYYGGYGYPLFDTSSSYDTPDPYQLAAPYMQMDQQLSDQINRLSDEVDRLREDQVSRQAPPSPSPVRQAAIPDQPTVLVFRDGHTREVTNYAIVGQTLWLLSEEHARKVAVGDLDVAATSKKNEERGVSFQLPE